MGNNLTTKQILEAAIAVPILEAAKEDVTTALQRFEKEHCWNTELQPMYAVAYLSRFVEQMESGVLYELHEPLQMVATMFFVDSRLYLIGPYCEREWDALDAEALLAGLGIPASNFVPYQRYRCQYNVANPETILRCVGILMEEAGVPSTGYTLRRVDYQTPRFHLNPMAVEADNDLAQVDRRYQMEAEFMQKIREGDAPGAKSALLRLNQNSQGVYYIRETSWNNLLGPTIIRTLVRIAAREAGLAPIVIDTITQGYAQKLNIGVTRRRSSRTDTVTEPLINDICEAIQKLHRQTYSAPVRQATRHIGLHLSSSLSASVLAQELHMSAGYLSKQFKLETGMTVGAYITNARVTRAAELLTATQHSVQDIAAYVGYLDNNYFTKVFKHQYGMTPTEYRRQALGGKK